MKKLSKGTIVAFCGALFAGIVGCAIDDHDNFIDNHIKLYNRNVDVANKNDLELFDRVEELERQIKELTKKEEN